MTGILDRIRNTTPDMLEGVTGDFSDAPAPVYRARVEREMIRTVKGATDLRDAMPARGTSSNAGLVGPGTIDTRPFKGQPTEPQRNFINSLMEQLSTLDQDTWQQALDYNLRMDEANAWDPSRDGNVSRWITRLKAKVADLKSRPASVEIRTGYPTDDAHQDIPNGYYAVADAGPDDIHFFRISRFRDGGIKLQEQASDVLHPVRRGGRRTAILNTIQTVGWRNAQELYGRTIGRCGRCGRTLTDAESRARGIGPDCWGKM